MSKDTITRDFIYMDIERVKSLYSQIEEGLIETRTRESGSDKQINGDVSGGVPLFTHAKAGLSALWHKEESETFTLHDHMYNHIESKLCEAGNFLDFNSKYDDSSWNREEFCSSTKTTSFIKVKGDIRIDDYGLMVSWIRELPKFGESIAYLTSISEDVPDSKESKNKLKATRQQMGFDKRSKKIFTNIADNIDRIYGDSVIVHFWPLRSANDCEFSCLINKALLRESISFLNYKFGFAPEDPWTMLGQIAKMTTKDQTFPAHQTEYQNEFEQTINQLFVDWQDIFQFGMAKFPTISITPIAIYRE